MHEIEPAASNLGRPSFLLQRKQEENEEKGEHPATKAQPEQASSFRERSKNKKLIP